MRKPVMAAGVLFCWGLMAGFLYAESRSVTIKAVADEEFRADPGWRDRIRGLLARASADFESLFGIHFEILGLEPWISDNGLKGLDAMALRLDAHVPRPNSDILIAFSAQRNPGERYIGYSLFREGVIILLDEEEPPALDTSLRHELAHLFGAVHVDDPDSLMDILARGASFDPINARIIRLSRDRTFRNSGFPIPRAHLRELSGIYRDVLTSGVRRIASRQSERDREPSANARPRAAREPRFWEEAFLFNLDDIHNLLAQIHLEFREYGPALEECRLALDVNPHNPQIRALIGVIHRRQGRIEEAASLYQELLADFPGDPRLHFNLGIANKQRGDYDAALAAFTRALELKPNFAETCTNMGEIHLRRGRIEDAERVLKIAVSLNPRLAAAHANLAEVGFRRGADFETQSELRIAMELGPELPGPYTTLGNLAFRDHRFEEAARQYHRALARDPRYERAHYNLGMCRLAQGRIDEAEGHFLQAIEACAHFPEPHAGLGYCMLLRHRWEAAVSEIIRAHSLGYSSARTHLNISYAYLQTGKPDLALEEARRALALEPTSADARANLGIAYLQKGKTAESADQFQAALTCDPRHKEARAGLGRLHLRLGNLDAALSSFLAASEIDPHDGVLFCRIAEVFIRMGDSLRAGQYLQKAELQEGALVAPLIARIRALLKEL